jgi:hypothetical protein
MIGYFLAALALQPAPNDRSKEGDWHVVDTTDNNTGEREVYAMQLFIDSRDFVRLSMVCKNGRPAFVVDWDDLPFPDHAVLTIDPLNDEIASPPQRYVFEKSKEITKEGLYATSEVSGRIVRAIGNATSISITAHLSSGDRIVIVDTDGTQGAWTRVSRHCPVRILPLPPI